MTADIEQMQPQAWVFGHTHHSLDVVVGRTRILSSQRGYVGAEPGADTYVPAIVALGR